jgi:hypothetical protein
MKYFKPVENAESAPEMERFLAFLQGLKKEIAY